MIESASHSLEIPSRLPFMMMGPTVLFPHAMMPLYIFEERYREMLRTVLESHRLFVVSAVDRIQSELSSHPVPESIGGLGVVRACKLAEDGTYNLVLQGLSRVQLDDLDNSEAYPTAQIKNLETVEPDDQTGLEASKERLTQLIRKIEQNTSNIPPEMLTYLGQVEDPEILLDLAIYTLCPPSSFKQQLLETLDLEERYQLFIEALEGSSSD